MSGMRDWQELPNNHRKHYDFSPVSAICSWSGTALRHTISRPDLWAYILYYFLLELLTCYVELPEIESKWTFVGYLVSLLTFTLVFFLNNAWTRYLSLYNDWSGMHDEVLEFSAIVAASVPYKISWKTSRLMLASLFVNLKSLKVEVEECFPSLLEQLLGAAAVEELRHCEVANENVSNQIDVWTITELRKSDLRGPELVTLQNKVTALSRRCRSLHSKIDMPIPFAYYHMTNMLLFSTFALLGYVLAAIENMALAILYSIMLLTFLGLRELAVDFMHPFHSETLDFPVEQCFDITMREVDAMSQNRPMPGALPESAEAAKEQPAVTETTPLMCVPAKSRSAQ